PCLGVSMQIGLVVLLVTGASGPPASANAADPQLLDRLAKLENRVGELETRNATLERELANSRPAAPAIAVQVTPDAFQPADRTSFTFRPHMVFQQDFAHFSGKRGGYDFRSGTL